MLGKAHRVYRSPLVSRIFRSPAHNIENVQIFTPGLDLSWVQVWIFGDTCIVLPWLLSYAPLLHLSQLHVQGSLFRKPVKIFNIVCKASRTLLTNGLVYFIRLPSVEYIPQCLKFHRNIPVAIETLGVFGPQFLKFIKNLWQCLKMATDEANSRPYLLQRISFAIHKGNTTSVFGILAHRKVFFTFNISRVCYSFVYCPMFVFMCYL